MSGDGRECTFCISATWSDEKVSNGFWKDSDGSFNGPKARIQAYPGGR